MNSDIKFTYTTDTTTGIEFLQTVHVDGRAPDVFDVKLDAATNAAACRTEARFLAALHRINLTQVWNNGIPMTETQYLNAYHDLKDRAVSLDSFVQDLS